MFLAVGKHISKVLRTTLGLRPTRMFVVRNSHSKSEETEADFDARYIKYFCRQDIDDWECRQAMNELLGMDLIPDPQVIMAALCACRRLNDYALATRWLEGCKDKCGGQKDLYDYLIREIQPTLCELGVLSVEEMGYDNPELALASVFD